MSVDSLLRWLLGFACRRPTLIRVAIGLLTLFFGYYAARLLVNPNTEIFIPENFEILNLVE